MSKFHSKRRSVMVKAGNSNSRTNGALQSDCLPFFMPAQCQGAVSGFRAELRVQSHSTGDSDSVRNNNSNLKINR